MSVGTIYYSPKKLGNTSPNWWMIIKCDPAIGEYFRHLYWLAHYRCHKLVRPAWKEHISLVRNEKPKKEYLWGVYAKQRFTFYFTPELKTDGYFYWLDVACPGATKMRAELGLAEDPTVPFHLTVGHTETEDLLERHMRRVKDLFGFTDCKVCGTIHKEKVVVCSHCAYKASFKG